MEFDFICTGLADMEPDTWNGHVRLLSTSDPYELEVTARHSSFHILCGKHAYGNYIWNLERLTTYYPELSIVDAISIVDVLAELSEHMVL